MPSRYIIDTNVLLQHPEILSRAGNRKLVIPRAVMHELSYRGKSNKWSDITDLVASSIPAGVLIVEAPEKIKNDIFQSDRNAQRLTGADFDIARIAISYAERQGEEVPCVVTNDRALSYFLASRNITSMTGIEFINESKGDFLNKEIEEKAEKAVSSQKRYLKASFVLGGLASLVANIVYSNIEVLVSTITVWGTMMGLPVLGLILFWYRENFRLSYGVFECCIGVIMSYYVLFPTFDYSSLGVKEGIQILGGLYAMVRGLDNIGKGVIGTRLETLWLKVF
ncbi:PIN domain-containing protein [Escherichia coli]|uniref:PIN domain-containing protein n=1 Tax=Escherichia coli TaxID=562 RepID=UPI000BE6E6C0|nr:PIN domain-containing protein [Escherichia coli]EFA2316920.1 twitching motility protein PilT [Escherichia coli]EFH6347897.1 twitching motility protein PilT [Escherichia coli]EGL7891838.1 twitching motility protein PilT [Escherichia coli]EGW6520661.1 twitching motility protein PilT [Escherichia coli]EHT7742566.1 twitching motility protein PilT [Escherichia coli]